MRNLTPRRTVSVTKKGNSFWTYTCEGKGLMQIDAVSFSFPITSVYLPTVFDGYCQYQNVGGMHSIADAIISPDRFGDHTDILVSLLHTELCVDGCYGNMTADDQSRFLSFSYSSKKCLWRRQILIKLFQEVDVESLLTRFGRVQNGTVAPGLGRFVVQQESTLGILLPCGTGWTNESLIFRLCEELISLAIVGAPNKDFLVGLCRIRLKKLAIRIPVTDLEIYMKLALIAHMQRNIGDSDLSDELGKLLIDWSDAYCEYLSAVNLTETYDAES